MKSKAFSVGTYLKEGYKNSNSRYSKKIGMKFNVHIINIK
jgi:hypothetical protein